VVVTAIYWVSVVFASSAIAFTWHPRYRAKVARHALLSIRYLLVVMLVVGLSLLLSRHPRWPHVVAFAVQAWATGMVFAHLIMNNRDRQPR
jgi:hypothetical protein